MAWIKSYPIDDALKSVINYQFGSYSGLGLMVMNRKAWDAYTDEQKRIVWDALPGAIARTVVKGYIGGDIAAKKAAAKLGIAVSKGGDDIQAMWGAHKKNEVKTAIDNARKLKLEDPEKIAAVFQENIGKWTKIVKDAGLAGILAAAGPDPSKLDDATVIYERLMREHIYAKVDPTQTLIPDGAETVAFPAPVSACIALAGVVRSGIPVAGKRSSENVPASYRSFSGRNRLCGVCGSAFQQLRCAIGKRSAQPGTVAATPPGAALSIDAAHLHGRDDRFASLGSGRRNRCRSFEGFRRSGERRERSGHETRR